MSTRFQISPTSIAGLTVLERLPIGDERGFLERLYCQDELADILAQRKIAQVNRTLTRKRGVVRGMHFQHPPHAECKIVSCLHGEVFDVAVDLRQGSPTFLHWHTQRLSGDNRNSFVIPEGFAHGFQTLTEDCEMLYFHTAPYNAQAEAGLNACDPALAIQWPLPITERSDRDKAHSMLATSFEGIVL